jgi:hypothetical protein
MYTVISGDYIGYKPSIIVTVDCFTIEIGTVGKKSTAEYLVFAKDRSTYHGMVHRLIVLSCDSSLHGY